MAKNPIITEEVEVLIAEFYTRHPNWKAKDIQKRVSQLLHKKSPELPQNWPGLSAVQKTLATVRKKAKELPDPPQEKPWSMATLDEYPISPSALPTVLKAYKSHMAEGSPISIRQAKWIARLSATEYSESLPNVIARTEQLYEILGHPPDFEIFDKILAGLPGQADNWQVTFAGMASLAGILKNDPTKKEGVTHHEH